jgi:Flp pilus assembly protein TadG
MLTNPLSRLRSRAAAAAGSENGAVAPLLGLMTLVLIGCTGVAIDTGRAMVVKARLASALDAAGLAVGARVATADYNADATKFVNANFKTDYAGASVDQTSIKATLSSDKSTISLTATAVMPTVFMRIFGSNSVTVSASTEITRASTGLELVMVLDNTGSMGQSNSMGALKTGAQSLVDGLLAGNPDDVFIGLVPFSQAVSIGPSLVGGAAFVTPATLVDVTSVLRDGYPTYWTGCLEERQKGFDQTDDPPNLLNANTLFKSYYSPDTADPVNGGGQVNDWITTNWLGIKKYSVFYTGYNNNQQQGPAAFCPQAMTPMTNDKSKITAGINAMTAQGSTFINVGAAWGWRMLSPKWRGVWGGDMLANKQPLNYDTKNMSKAAVIMTDGENSFTDKYYTAYGYLADGRLGTTNRSTAESTLDTKLTAICSSMKTAGITVFTIAYDNPKKDTKDLLESCASNTSYYFDAKNTTDLISKFDLIRGALSKLRVSK